MSYDDCFYTREDMDKLEAELAEARAQIATFKELYAKEGHAKMVMLEELSEARAQIAAKDAALKAASHALRSYQYGNSATDLAEDVANRCDAALAASARETE